jgi:hypothetical protein
VFSPQVPEQNRERRPGIRCYFDCVFVQYLSRQRETDIGVRRLIEIDVKCFRSVRSELRVKLVEVLAKLMADPDLPNEVEFIGAQQIVVA